MALLADTGHSGHYWPRWPPLAPKRAPFSAWLLPLTALDLVCLGSYFCGHDSTCRRTSLATWLFDSAKLQSKSCGPRATLLISQLTTHGCSGSQGIISTHICSPCGRCSRPPGHAPWPPPSHKSRPHWLTCLLALAPPLGL